MEQLDGVARKRIGFSILEEVYSEAKAYATPMDDVLVSHVALFMVQYSLARNMMKEGILPDIILGTSLGESVACAISGGMSKENALHAVIIQAKCIKEKCSNGTMIAVLDSPSLFKNGNIFGITCELVSVNYCRHFVISVDANNANSVLRKLEDNKISHVRLPVKYAFHSSSMDRIYDEYVSHMKEFDVEKVCIPIASCATGTIVNEIDQYFFWRFLRKEIFFRETVRSARSKDFKNIYIDLGPSGTLSNMLIHGLLLEGSDVTMPSLSIFGKDCDNVAKIIDAVRNR
jgi:acyl transferase domain-containing protein